MTEFYIPAGPGEATFTEKRSEFLGHVRYVETEEAAKAFVAEVKKEHYDARHNCWCYAIKDGPVRYSDDGEPQGTAGVPMLEVFQKQGITNYTKSAKDALDAAGVSVVRRWVAVEIPCPYAWMERLKLEIEAFSGILTDTEYGANVVLRTLIPEEHADEFAARVVDATAGSIAVQVVGETFRPVKIR